MASTEDVKKLAALARISVSDTELERFTKEFDSIIAYVDTLKNLEVSPEMVERPYLPYVNIFREDGAPHEKGKWTEKLAEQFPEREGDALAVKQIISHD